MYIYSYGTGFGIDTMSRATKRVIDSCSRDQNKCTNKIVDELMCCANDLQEDTQKLISNTQWSEASKNNKQAMSKYKKVLELKAIHLDASYNLAICELHQADIAVARGHSGQILIERALNNLRSIIVQDTSRRSKTLGLAHHTIGSILLQNVRNADLTCESNVLLNMLEQALHHFDQSETIHRNLSDNAEEYFDETLSFHRAEANEWCMRIQLHNLDTESDRTTQMKPIMVCLENALNQYDKVLTSESLWSKAALQLEFCQWLYDES